MNTKNIPATLNITLEGKEPDLMKTLIYVEKIILSSVAEHKFWVYSFQSSFIQKAVRRIFTTKFRSA